MPKEIRFSQLVQKAGKPEAVTLWTKPKDNPAFMKAVNENRIVTVIQNPTGTKKDVGTIGFRTEKFAAYLVFPKPLPKLEAVHVIGIKYELLREQVAGKPREKKIESAKAIQRDFSHDGSDSRREHQLKPEKEPVKKFQVKMIRTVTAEVALAVVAKNISEAETIALEKVKTQPFQVDDIEDKVKSITQV